MKLCPQCNFENIRNRFYCESCGTLLPSSPSQVPTSMSSSQKHTPPSSQMLMPLPLPISISSFNDPEQQRIAPPQSRIQSILYRTARIVLYLVGTLIAAFGLFVFLTTFTSAAIIGFLSLFLGSIVLLLITSGLHRIPLLNWRQRLLGELMVTGGTFALLLIGAVIVGMQPAGSIDKVANIVYGSIILIYGIVIAAVALW